MMGTREGINVLMRYHCKQPDNAANHAALLCAKQK